MTVQRGESGRNTPRTGSRNSAPLDLLMQKAGLRHVSVLYQYCKNYRCRQIEALVIPTTQDEFTLSDPILCLGDLLGVPVVLVLHEPKDEFLTQPVTVTVFFKGERKSVRPDVKWGEVAKYMRSLHKHHESVSTDANCGIQRYDDVWLQAGRRRGTDTDLSLSNMLRAVPGVGHIDIDALTVCPTCSSPTCVIEASSDGMKGTQLQDKSKATSMSRKIARTLDVPTLLLQHHVKDDSHEHPVSVTAWDSRGRHEADLSAEQVSWDAAQATVQKVAAMHGTC